MAFLKKKGLRGLACGSRFVWVMLCVCQYEIGLMTKQIEKNGLIFILNDYFQNILNIKPNFFFKFFAGPKRGRCTPGFSIFVRLSGPPFDRSFVRSSLLVKVYSYMVIIPLTSNIFTDSESPIKWQIGVPIIGDPDPPTPLWGAKLFFWRVLPIEYSDPYAVKYFW